MKKILGPACLAVMLFFFVGRPLARKQPSDVAGTWRLTVTSHNAAFNKQFSNTSVDSVLLEKRITLARRGVTGWASRRVPRLYIFSSPSLSVYDDLGRKIGFVNWNFDDHLTFIFDEELPLSKGTVKSFSLKAEDSNGSFCTDDYHEYFAKIVRDGG